MNNLIIQLQLLLGALSALLPLLPEGFRIRAGAILAIAAEALSLGGSMAADAEEVARKLAAVRSEVEAMAASHHTVTADELDAALARVDAASAAFRNALAAANEVPA
jgi:hypothetical protein